MTATSPLELVALRDLPDYRVCSEDSDPRGWIIYDAEGVQVGAVIDLIIDLQALIARYIVCSVTHDARQVLIPTGFARLDDTRRTMHLDFINAADAHKLPAYTGLPLSEEYSVQLEKVLTGAASAPSPEAKIIRRNS